MGLTHVRCQRIADVVSGPKAWPVQSARLPQDPCAALNGILWILRTGAHWKDLLEQRLPRSASHLRLWQ